MYTIPALAVHLYYWVIKWNFLTNESSNSFWFFVDYSFWCWDCKDQKPGCCAWSRTLHLVLTQPWWWVRRRKVSFSLGSGKSHCWHLLSAGDIADGTSWYCFFSSLKERWFRRGLVFPTALSTEEAGGCTQWRSHRCSSFQRGAEGAGILVRDTQWVTRGACQPLRGSEGNQSSMSREDSGDHLAPKKHLQRNLEHSRKI